MGRLNKVIDSILFHLLAAAMVGLVAICFLQVVVRYVFNASFSWVEEVSICLMIWATWVGACLAVQRGTHLRIVLVADKFEPTTRIKLQLALNGLSIAFLVFVGFSTRVIIDGMADVPFQSLPWIPMNAMYVSVPIGCILMIYYLLRTALMEWKSLRTLARRQE